MIRTPDHDASADACTTAPQASVGTPADRPDAVPTAHGTPVLRDDAAGEDTPVYDDRTDDRPAP